MNLWFRPECHPSGPDGWQKIAREPSPTTLSRAMGCELILETGLPVSDHGDFLIVLFGAGVNEKSLAVPRNIKRIELVGSGLGRRLE